MPPSSQNQRFVSSLKGARPLPIAKRGFAEIGLPLRRGAFRAAEAVAFAGGTACVLAIPFAAAGR